MNCQSDYHIAYHEYHKVRKVSDQLFKLSNIHYFCYQHLDANGCYTFLPTWPEPGRHVLQEEGYKKSWVFTSQLRSSNGCILWDIAKNFNTQSHDELTHVFHEMNLVHGIDIVDYHNGCREFYTFASQYPDIYHYPLKSLYQFIFFFRQECRQLIEEAKKEKFFVPTTEQARIQIPILDNFSGSDEINDIIRPDSIKRYYLDTNNPSTYLTAKEVACLAQVALGKNVKEIARSLEISFRTVESHMYNIRNKLGCKQVIEAVNIARKYHIL